MTAAQDNDAVNDSATISHAVTGGDYAGVTVESVVVTVDDDETADTTAPRVASITRQNPTSLSDQRGQPDLAGDVQRGGLERGCGGFRGERNDRDGDGGRNGLRGDGRV